MLSLQFRLQEDVQIKALRLLLSELLDGRGKQARVACTMTAERSNGKESVLELISTFGISFMSVMPDHILQSHLFIAASYLNPSRDNDGLKLAERKLEVAVDRKMSEFGTALGDVAVSSSSGVCDDRCSSFIIDDEPKIEPQIFFASKPLRFYDSLLRQHSISAVAIKEYEPFKFKKVL